MQELGILKYLTILHVVTFRITETSLEVVLNILQRGICSCLEFVLNVFKSYGMFDQGVVVRILSFRRKSHELEGGNLAPVVERRGMNGHRDMMVGGKEATNGGLRSNARCKADKSRTPC